MPKGSLQRFQFEALMINTEDSTPLFRQLEDQLRDAIYQRRLLPNERLPSSRRLAQQLNISRNTVINAYDQLATEGFLETSKGSGTRVNPQLVTTLGASEVITSQQAPQLVSQSPEQKIQLSTIYNTASKISHIVPKADGSPARPFRAHTPACNEFPSAIWAQLMTHRLRLQPEKWMERNHPCGYAPLRGAISSYLGAFRGINASSDNVVITAGTQQSIDLLAKALINPGDIVCFEEPGYTPASTVFEMAGANICAIPVDDEGIDVDYLKENVSQAKLIYVTPSSHFPLGMPMSLARREALIRWACESGAIIIEDDYNGEYRYQGNPLPALHTMAGFQNVIYLGSFSKLLFPALRLGYMLIPIELFEPMSTLRWLADRHSPPLEQAVLTDFINQGHFARHLRKMRQLYAQRQQVFVDAAKEYLSDLIHVPALASGLHLVGWLNRGVEEELFLNACSAADVEVMATSRFSTQSNGRACVIFGYAPYTEEDIVLSIQRIQIAWQKIS